MKNLRKRVEMLERLKPKLQQEEHKPLGVALGCSPDAFINWYDHCLHPDSKWHTLSFQEKYEAVTEFCYKPGYNLPEYADSLSVELLDCDIALFRAEERARRKVKPGEEFEYAELTNEEKDTYKRAMQEEEERLRGTIKWRA